MFFSTILLAGLLVLGTSEISTAQPPAAAPDKPPPVTAAPKVLRYAQALFRRLDANRDGRVDGPEFSAVGPNASSIDANRDGGLTEQELIAFIAAYGQARRLRAVSADMPRPAASPAAQTLAPTPNPAPAGNKQFYVDPKRLPAGLPPWFLERDADGDGQLTPSEFQGGGQSPMGAEFEKLDRNHDGLVTAAEVAGPATKTSKVPAK